MWSEKRLPITMRSAPRRRKWGATAGSLLLILAAVSGTLGEIDVTIKIPIAVAENSTVKMTCDYDLRSMPLYSVKWYKSRDEFYRFIPKEMPSKSVFPLLAAKVDYNRSDEHSVVLNNVNSNMAGKYRCEVSTEGPTFITRTESGYMHVVKLPRGNVTAKVEKPKYALCDTVRGNCTAPPGNPPANVTWSVNGRPVNSSYIKYIPMRSVNDNRSMTVAGLEFQVDHDSFRNGTLQIICRASIFHLYREQALLVLEEERPRLASVLGTRESSPSKSTATSVEGWFLALAIADVLLGSMR